MGLIKLKGIKLRAYHGCLDEEERIGGEYIVNVSVQGDFENAEDSDALKDTVDYGEVTAIVKAQMSIRSKLIEHVAKRILHKLEDRWTWMNFTVEVVKLKPPINGNVEQVSYMLGSTV